MKNEIPGAPEENSEAYSFVSYLYENDGSFLAERVQEVIEAINEALVRDATGKLTGVVDNSFFLSHEAEHLNFIIYSKARSVTEIYDLELPDGTKMEDIIFNDERMQQLADSTRSEEVVITRRAVMMLVVAEKIAESLAVQSDSNQVDISESA